MHPASSLPFPFAFMAGNIKTLGSDIRFVLKAAMLLAEEACASASPHSFLSTYIRSTVLYFTVLSLLLSQLFYLKLVPVLLVSSTYTNVVSHTWKRLCGKDAEHQAGKLSLGCNTTTVRFVAVPSTCELRLCYQAAEAKWLALAFPEGSSFLSLWSVGNCCFLQAGIWGVWVLFNGISHSVSSTIQLQSSSWIIEWDAGTNYPKSIVSLLRFLPCDTLTVWILCMLGEGWVRTRSWKPFTFLPVQSMRVNLCTLTLFPAYFLLYLKLRTWLCYAFVYWKQAFRCWSHPESSRWHLSRA